VKNIINLTLILMIFIISGCLTPDQRAIRDLTPKQRRSEMRQYTGMMAEYRYWIHRSNGLTIKESARETVKDIGKIQIDLRDWTIDHETGECRYNLSERLPIDKFKNQFWSMGI
jgi:hypothetical protein